MNKRLLFLAFLFGLIIFSCNKDEEIKRLLNSNKPTEIIEGTCEAGESDNKDYVPLLLHDAGNPNASTALRWKGYTVYEEKMYALQKILNVKPPHLVTPSTSYPDSVNIKFYNNLWQKMAKSK